MVELETCWPPPFRSKPYVRRAHSSGHLEAASLRRSGNSRLRASRWDTAGAGSFSEGRHRTSCVVARSQARRRRMMSPRYRSWRSCGLLGTLIVVVMASSGRGLASARIVGMQQTVSGKAVPNKEGWIGSRRLDSCSSDSDCTPSEAEQEALDMNGRDIYCDEACEDTGSDIYGGTWCDWFGKEGCRGCDVSNCVGTDGDCVPCEEAAPVSAPLEGLTNAPADVLDELSTSIPATASDTEPCTIEWCESMADEADIAYINDNSLTLYCDPKCSDTSSDPYGGLWCNMRGLGQLCRACREDDCDDWDTNDTCLPCAEIQVTPAPSDIIQTPAPSEVIPTPLPSEVIPTPLPSEVIPTPLPSEVIPTPLPSEVIPTPLPSEVIPTPLPSEVIPTPLPSEVIPTPLPSEVIPTPLPSEVIPTPLPSEVIPTPLPSEVIQTPAPTDVIQTPAPSVLTPIPVETVAPVETAVPGSTLPPGVTPAPSTTLIPLATPVPGATVAPGTTLVPETLPPGVTSIPTPLDNIKTMLPSAAPSMGPTTIPTGSPTAVQTGSPTAIPTGSPTAVPTGSPTAIPTGSPTAVPTGSPTGSPTAVPTGSPTALPTGSPFNVSPTDSIMTASMKLDGVTGTTDTLQDGLKEGFQELLTDEDGSQPGVNVIIESQSSVASTTASTRIRGRRYLQNSTENACNIDDGETCTIEATATVTYTAGTGETSGDSSARGVDSLSKKDSFEKIGTSAGVEASDVTMSSLIVSADPDSLVLDTDTHSVVGQTVSSSSDPTVSNYWLFIMACVLLLTIWLCCLGTAWLRYRNAKEERATEQARCTSAGVGHWGAESYRNPPSPAKGEENIKRVKMDSEKTDYKRREKDKSAKSVGGGGDSQVGLRSSLEDIPEESGSSSGDPNSRENSRGKVITQASVGKSSWEEEEDEDEDEDEDEEDSWDGGGIRDSFHEARAIPSGRLVLSKGKQRSTGSSSFSDELVAQRGTEGNRKFNYGRKVEAFTSEELDQRTSNTSSGVSGSGSGNISSSFASSAGVTSTTFDDDNEDDDDKGSSDYEDSEWWTSEKARQAASGGNTKGSLKEVSSGIPEQSPENS